MYINRFPSWFRKNIRNTLAVGGWLLYADMVVNRYTEAKWPAKIN